MMRKFPKLLAVVLAIAIIICPAMCLTSMAETANDYTVSYENNVVTVDVDAAAGFLVALLRLDVAGFTVDEDAIAVTTAEGIEFGANPDFDADAGVLSLLLAAKDAANIELVTSATVTIPVEKTATDDNYGIKLTTIQAADKGAEVDGVLVAESFLEFPYVADAENGAIDLEAAADKTVAVAPCAHAKTTEKVVDATCTADGSITVTCDICGEVISEETIKSEGHATSEDYDYDDNYHWFNCDNCSEKVDVAEHVFDDDADADCICGFTREVDTHVCEFLTYTYVNADTHKEACECGVEQTVAHAYDEDGVCPCGANPPKEVSNGFVFSSVTYDAAANVLKISRSKPDANVSAANTAAKEAGNRWRGVRVIIGSTEHRFQMDYTNGAGTFNITGLAFTDMAETIVISYLITGNDFSYETDSFTVKVFELLEGVKRRDDKVAKMLDLYEATKTAETFAVEPTALSEVKGFTYGAITYNPVTCTIVINRSKPDSTVSAANSAAKEAGNRWRGVRVIIGSTEHKFQMDYTNGAGTFNITGLAITDICEDITVSYLITGNDFSYESGSVTVSVGDLIAASTGTLADAYNAFMG